jgi:hypothetical protein
MAKLPAGSVPARYTVAAKVAAPLPGRASGVSLDEASDPIWRATQKGFKTDAIICEKDVPGLYYKIKSVDPDGITLESLTFGRGTPVTAQYTIEAILQGGSWKVFKDTLPFVFEGSDVDRYCPIAEAIMTDVDDAKCEAFAALKKRLHDVGRHNIQYALTPSQVLAMEPYAKGKLELVPFTTLRPINEPSLQESKAGYTSIKVEGHTLALHEPIKPRANVKEVQTNSMFVPFWWVTATSEPSKANVELQKRTVGTTSFVVYINTRKIEAFEVLCYKSVKKAMPTPLSKAAAVTKEGGATGSATKRKHIDKA